jgi:hypothetical protein
MELFGNANRWTQNAVNEYRAMFVAFGTFFPLLGVQLLSWPILAIPVWFLGCGLNRRSRLLHRAPVFAMALGLFGFACLEMKVSHLFVILYPWVLITGGAWCVERFGAWMVIGAKPRKVICGALGLGAVVVLFFGLPPRQETLNAFQLDVRDLAEKLVELQEDNGDDEMRSVLAYWHWGAKLMYYGRVPMVASGYHRNLAGIEDSYRVLVARSWEECEPILRARKVRWILSVWGFDFLHEIPKVLPSMPQFMTMDNIRMNPDGGVGYNFAINTITETTLHFFLTTWHSGVEGDPHYQLVYEGGRRVPARDHEGTLPTYRIWRVVYPGEGR